MAKREVTQELIKSLFELKDWVFYWKVKPAIAVKIGDVAGCVNPVGYGMIRIDSVFYYKHVLIFLWHHGYIPEIVDHEDGNPFNNNIKNLRAATARQNSCNRCSAKGSSSIYLGVGRKRNRWYAAIRVNRKPMHIGHYLTQEEAALNYNKFAVKYHGEFANLNIIK